jgi:hypothetical protein
VWNAELAAAIYISCGMLAVPMIWYAVWGKTLPPMQRSTTADSFNELAKAS